MSYIFYVIGVIGLAAAALILSNGYGSTEAGPLALVYAGATFVGAMGFFAVGRVLDYLAVIAKMSRNLELMDPDVVARREERAQRTFFGLGPKRA